MKQSTNLIIKDLFDRYPSLLALEEKITDAVTAILTCYLFENKVMVCGNGGSAADSLHLVGELMKGFVLPRGLSPETKSQICKKCVHGEYLAENLQGSLPAVSLVGETALSTAFANDVASDLSFAQSVFGLGKKGDVLIAFSTSGNSKNVVYASEIAQLKNVLVIGFTGSDGGLLKETCDILINVPEAETYKIQELHLPIYHTICLAIENEFFGGKE